jgi:transcriptional regulator with XRE-family HTH domain
MISKTILMLMDAHGISLKELADRSGKSSETLKNIIYDKVENPGVLTLKAIGDVFGVSINFLLGEPFISPEESALIENYRRSGRRGKNVIELIAKYEATAARSERNAKGKHSIPCVVPKGNIRKGIVYDTNETIEISTVVDEAYMAITITSNDLAPRFCKNDSILFEKRFPENGEIVAFIVADRVYIRNFIEENGRYIMKCLHNHGEDMVFKRMDEIILVGTCCGVIRD